MLLGSVRVDPPLVLAPCWRRCAQLGSAAGASARAWRGDDLRYGAPVLGRRTGRMLAVDPDEHPVSLQIAAGRPEVAGRRHGAAPGGGRRDRSQHGLPGAQGQEDRRRRDAGARPGLARAIMDATVEAAAGIPVTVKMRAGWDDDSISFMRIADRRAPLGARELRYMHGRPSRCMPVAPSGGGSGSSSPMSPCL